ncbi:uncharacterized protein ColSpa_00127 [Colletotrichum spaethianum]|uniref:Uncharacterized protein n=1 Tax=Colletotrichum spaethianum TaxID=700344 RepID=A0AA37L1F9_9PEZI|nr:uncharacterized protein ColSpa_00127 [Colletotrichum spaethianum]GKT39946.1 hypothetical protein ColSpa_00127 [Colletotrichum spaethianum]
MPGIACNDRHVLHSRGADADTDPDQSADPDRGLYSRRIAVAALQASRLPGRHFYVFRFARAVCTGTAPTTAPSAATAVSYVSNEYFPFPYIATSLDRGECSSAVSQCSRNYQSCVTQLDGNSGFGVTVIVPGGGGTTVAATRPDVGSSATPICSSLSSRACYGLENDQCAQSTTVNGVVINAAARPTAACIAGIAAGVGVAVLGAMR